VSETNSVTDGVRDGAGVQDLARSGSDSKYSQILDSRKDRLHLRLFFVGGPHG
jgi:hypothetical protein